MASSIVLAILCVGVLSLATSSEAAISCYECVACSGTTGTTASSCDYCGKAEASAAGVVTSTVRTCNLGTMPYEGCIGALGSSVCYCNTALCNSAARASATCLLATAIIALLFIAARKL